jgi:hypothetical protein
MKGHLIIHNKVTDELGNTLEIKMWRVPVSQHTPHGYKYSLVYIVGNERAIGYDNERGKGDHKHLFGNEHPYSFKGLRELARDFKRDIASFKEKHHAG